METTMSHRFSQFCGSAPDKVTSEQEQIPDPSTVVWHFGDGSRAQEVLWSKQTKRPMMPAMISKTLAILKNTA